MTIETKLLSTLAVRSLSLEQIGELFGLTQDELDDPNCGLWIVDEIKQLKTSQILARTEQMRKSPNQSVSAYTHSQFVRASQITPEGVVTDGTVPTPLPAQTDTAAPNSSS